MLMYFVHTVVLTLFNYFFIKIHFYLQQIVIIIDKTYLKLIELTFHAKTRNGQNVTYCVFNIWDSKENLIRIMVRCTCFSSIVFSRLEQHKYLLATQTNKPFFSSFSLFSSFFELIIQCKVSEI